MTNLQLSIKNLLMSFNDTVVLKNINLDFERGDFVAVLGKSGAGKSTLLRCINKLNEPKQGQIILNGNDLLKLNSKQLEKERKNIAFIFQDYNILDNLYTIENVLTSFLANKNFFKAIFGIYDREEYELALKYLEKVGLKDEAYKKSKYLSGGQKQRVAIARSICQKPVILLADEPVSSLDEKNSNAIMELFTKLNKKKKITIIVNLHDVDLAKKYCKKIVGIKDGEISFYKNTERVTDDEIRKLYL